MTKITKSLIDGNVYTIFKTNDIRAYNIPKALNRTEYKMTYRLTRRVKKSK